MNPPSDDDPLDVLLREEPAYLDDDGFTARVMAALPARRPLSWLRPALILVATVLGLTLAIWWLLEGENQLPAATMAISSSEWGAILIVGGSLLVSLAWGAVAALRWE